MIDLNECPSLSTMFNYLVVLNSDHMHCTHGHLTFNSMSVIPTDKKTEVYTASDLAKDILRAKALNCRSP